MEKNIQILRCSQGTSYFSIRTEQYNTSYANLKEYMCSLLSTSYQMHWHFQTGNIYRFKNSTEQMVGTIHLLQLLP